MNRNEIIVCPCGQMTAYQYFRWVHMSDGIVCPILGSSHYEEVAASYHRSKSVHKALTEPDYPWLVTPQGVDAVCEWLSEGTGSEESDAEQQYERMVTLMSTPVFFLLGHTLRVRVRAFQRNMRYVQKVLGGEPRWMRIYLAGATGRKFSLSDFFRYRPNPELDDVAREAREALDRRRAEDYVKSQEASRAMADLQRLLREGSV